jgi:hypothetical protein
VTIPKDLNVKEILALFKDDEEQLPTGLPVQPFGGFRRGEMVCLSVLPRPRPSLMQRLAMHRHLTGDSVFMVSLETTPEQAAKAYARHLGVELDQATLDHINKDLFKKPKEN